MAALTTLIAAFAGAAVGGLLTVRAHANAADLRIGPGVKCCCE